MPDSITTMNLSTVTRPGARSNDRARPGASDVAALREKLAEAVAKILDVMDHIDGDPDYEVELPELADDSLESGEPVRDPVLYFLSVDRAMRANTNDELGIVWWNRLSDSERQKWMAAAGNTGRAVDAWRAFQKGEVP
jgi:hypothetical protein